MLTLLLLCVFLAPLAMGAVLVYLRLAERAGRTDRTGEGPAHEQPAQPLERRPPSPATAVPGPASGPVRWRRARAAGKTTRRG